MENKIECPVCYDVTSNYYLSPCKHSWCTKCNLNPKFPRKCPLCRIQVPLSPKSRKLVKKRERNKEMKEILIIPLSNHMGHISF